MIYSANMLKTYKSCPQKYKLKYEEKFSLPQNYEIFEKGKKVHALAYYYLRGDNIDRMETALNPEEKVLWLRLKQNEFFNKYTYSAEYDLNCKVADFWIGGRLDAVVYDEPTFENGLRNYYILDYKTGKIPDTPSQDLQTLVYLSTLKAHLNNNFNSLKFVYIDLKNNKNHIIDINEVDFSEIKTICANINSQKFQPNKSHCQSCEYRYYC